MVAALLLLALAVVATIVVAAVITVVTARGRAAEVQRQAAQRQRDVAERERQERLVAQQRAAEQQAQMEFMRPEAIIQRRLEADALHIDRGTAAVTVRAKATRGGYAGSVITATGKELWRCSHSHPSVKRSRGDWQSVDPGIEAARACASAELARDQRRYEQLAGEAVGNGIKAKRAPIEDAGYETWGWLWRAFDGRCAYCGLRETDLHQDHVIPLSRGGANDFSNVLPACSRCNLLKGTRTLSEFLPHMKERGISAPAWFPNGTRRVKQAPPRAKPKPSKAPVVSATAEVLPPMDLPPQPEVCSNYLKRGDGHCRRCGNHWYDHNKP